MISIDQPYRPNAYVLDRETAPAFWLVGILWMPMATSPQTANRFTLIEQQMQKGPGPVSHAHPYDEGFFVVEGQCTFNPYGENVTLGAGGYLHIPRHAEHSFVVDADHTRVLNYYTPAGFELLLMGTAQLAASRTIPTPEQVPLPPADQVEILSGLFGQERVGGMPFIDAPEPGRMKTSPVPWTPVALMHAEINQKPQRDFLGEQWRVLASSPETGGTYSLCEVATPANFKEQTHIDGHDEAIYVLEGFAELTLDGRSHQLKEGSFAYIPAGTARRLGSTHGVRSLRFMFPGGFENAIERFGTVSEKASSDNEKRERDAAIATYRAAMGVRIID